MGESNRAGKVGLAVVLLVVAVTIFSLRRSDGPTTQGAWYYDVGTGQLFVGDPYAYPPVDAPSGAGAGMMAFVYSCDACDAANQQTTHLQRYNDHAKQLLAGGLDHRDPEAAEAVMAVQAGQMVAIPPAEPGAEIHWVAMSDPAGAQIVDAWRTLCGGGTAKPCYPDR